MTLGNRLNDHAPANSVVDRPLVQIRTPTYKRPDMLKRCIEMMLAQSWTNWICDVYDDDPGASGRAICEEIADSRVHYHQNVPQLFASKNIDQCFSRANPRNAAYFCVVEDDNFILPEFIEENIRICREMAVNLVLRNQWMEIDSGTPEARLSSFGIFDRMFVEGIYTPELFRLSLIPGIGVSNGALFWSDSAISQLEIQFPCTATLQEYMRTFSIWENMYVAMKPLAVWAQNGTQTTRDLGGTAGYLRRELDLKRAVQKLQGLSWKLADRRYRREFLETDRFAFSKVERARGLAKSLIPAKIGTRLPLHTRLELLARGVLIRTTGRLPANFESFISSRVATKRANA